MAESANERISIDASPARCFEVATEFEHYPDWAADVKQVEVLESDDDGRGAKVEYRAAALGRSIRYVLEYDYSEAPAAFGWSLVEGDMLKRLDGRYGFEPDGDGTNVAYDLTVEIGIPMPGLVKRQAARRIIGTALKELKKEAERLP
jgi:ribosome-associated toxin RatA of RatAB toxin-antitoxin module